MGPHFSCPATPGALYSGFSFQSLPFAQMQAYLGVYVYVCLLAVRHEVCLLVSIAAAVSLAFAAFDFSNKYKSGLVIFLVYISFLFLSNLCTVCLPVSDCVPLLVVSVHGSE